MIHNLLLIDDSDVDNYVTEQLLKRTKIAEHLTIKLSADEALKYLHGLTKNNLSFPEIILLDINMPEMNGFEFLQHFSHFPRPAIASSCIIMLTSSNDPEDMKRAKDSEFVMDYFVKPLSHAHLKKMAGHYETLCSRK
jgi:CheY-like chemotaxis protein